MSDPQPFHRQPSQPPADAPWQIVEQTTVYENPWSRVIQERLRHRNGQAGLYAFFAPVDCAVLIPLCGSADQARVHLVQQWRQAYRESTWELPCGRLDAGETPRQAGERELAEECGLVGGSWQVFGEWLHSDARVAGVSHCFLVRDAQPTAASAALDSSETGLQSQAFTLPELWRMLDQGQIRQVTTVAALCRLRWYILSDPALAALA